MVTVLGFILGWLVATEGAANVIAWLTATFDKLTGITQ
jgi:hypothetical protein